VAAAIFSAFVSTHTSGNLIVNDIVAVADLRMPKTSLLAIATVASRRWDLFLQLFSHVAKIILEIVWPPGQTTPRMIFHIKRYPDLFSPYD
jgi:hypothetical protein